MRTSALYKEKLRKKITLLWKVSTAHNVSLVRIMIAVWLCCIWKIKIHSSWEKQGCLNWYRCSSRPLTPDLRPPVSLVRIFLLQCFYFCQIINKSNLLYRTQLFLHFTNQQVLFRTLLEQGSTEVSDIPLLEAELFSLHLYLQNTGTSKPWTPTSAPEKLYQISEAIFPFTHQPQPFNILVSGCRYDDFLPPVSAQEVLQVALKRLPAGQFLRKVDGSNGWMIAVVVQLLLEHFVDLVEWAQENLVETKLLMGGDQNK